MLTHESGLVQLIIHNLESQHKTHQIERMYVENQKESCPLANRLVTSISPL